MIPKNRSSEPKMARWIMIGRCCRIGGDVVELEAFRQGEIQLDGGALPHPADGVLDLEIDFGAVEGAAALINLVVALRSRASIRPLVARSQTASSPIDFSGQVERLIS